MKEYEQSCGMLEKMKFDEIKSESSKSTFFADDMSSPKCLISDSIFGEKARKLEKLIVIFHFSNTVDTKVKSAYCVKIVRARTLPRSTPG